MQPNEVIKAAIDGHTKGVAVRMGKSDSYVYKMMAEPDSCRYTRFLQLFLAIIEENPAGADEIAQDFWARYELVRDAREAGSASKPGDSVGWLDAVSKVVEETSESIQAAIAQHDEPRLMKEIVEAIEALRGLLRMTVARSGESESGHKQTRPRAAIGIASSRPR